MPEAGSVRARSLTGVGVSAGVRAGPVLVMADPVPPQQAVPVAPAAGTSTADPATERRKAVEALHAVAEELRDRGARAAAAGHQDAQAVLDAQALMADDPVLAEQVRSRTEAGEPAADAVHRAFETHRALLAGAGAYLAARVTDLDDVRDRTVARLLGRPSPGIPESATPFVLVASDLAPAETALLDPAKVVAFVTEQGGPTSHTAILARSMGIPAVVGCAGCRALPDGTTVLVDGDAGRVVVSPSAEEIRAAESGPARVPAAGGPRPARGSAASGRVALLANIGGPHDLDAAVAFGAEGIGLFRTELLFLDRREAPGPAEQEEAYRRVFTAFPHGRVVVRVLDAGADKPLAFLPPPEAEPNPALGERGLRLLRRHPEVLAAQLTALGRAADGSGAEVAVMAPMVCDPDEAGFFVEQCRQAGLSRAGIMIETPAAALRTRDLAPLVDFVSIGTNDLAQYAFAADRQLGWSARWQDPWQPATLDLIAVTAEAAAAVTGCECGVCGEAAADPALACVLAGLGVTSLSMAAPALPAVRAALDAHTIGQCRAAAAAARDQVGAPAARTAARATLPGLP